MSTTSSAFSKLKQEAPGKETRIQAAALPWQPLNCRVQYFRVLAPGAVPGPLLGHIRLEESEWMNTQIRKPKGLVETYCLSKGQIETRPKDSVPWGVKALNQCVLRTRTNTSDSWELAKPSPRWAAEAWQKLSLLQVQEFMDDRPDM